MFAALLARLGFAVAAPVVKTLARPLIYLAAAGALCIAVWLVIGWDERRIAAAHEAGVQIERARMTAEIERGNREVAERQAERAIAAGIASAKLAAEKQAAEARIIELERENAALPNASRIGLSRARARLLR